jgi:hypothetical protein
MYEAAPITLLSSSPYTMQSPTNITQTIKLMSFRF